MHDLEVVNCLSSLLKKTVLLIYLCNKHVMCVICVISMLCVCILFSVLSLGIITSVKLIPSCPAKKKKADSFMDQIMTEVK